MEFRGFPKVPRLHRTMVITEKIDGTNAAVIIERMAVWESAPVAYPAPVAEAYDPAADELFGLWAQSRKRLITPGKSTDNYGFAGWVADNANELVKLGEGRHFGEWWGKGIQRAYDLDEKRFSLFNTGRWAECSDEPDTPGDKEFAPPCCHVVPVLEEHTFDHNRVFTVLEALHDSGSRAAPGFPRPEGIMIYHVHANQMFKVTLEDDELPKSLAERA